MSRTKEDGYFTRIAIENMSKLLSKENISYYKIAEDIGLSPTYLYYMRDKTTMTLETACKIASYLDVSLDYLITEHKEVEDGLYRSSRLSDETQKYIIGQVVNGRSATEVSDELGINFDRVWGVIRRHNIHDTHERVTYKGVSGKPPRVKFKVVDGSRLTKEALAYIKQKVSDKVPIGDIARDLGLKYHNVYSVAQSVECK